MSEERYKILHMTVDKKRQSYSRWFNSPVEVVGGYMRDGDSYITHGDFIVDFYSRLREIIQAHGQCIEDEKYIKTKQQPIPTPPRIHKL